ncbi:hypothetical protein [Nioella nitratireducens]|uniref:hypothetical protein n=1 Tax=Nioella nitratireducens TaxID=1287720 RepID=UPI0008FD2CDD|nr:hypothetical protein [Nioella nitratireducens]
MRQVTAAAATYAGWVFAAGFCLGTVRVLVLLPRTGAFWAEVIEVPFMLTLAYFIARWRIARHEVPARVAERLVMGGVAFVLLICAEIALSVFGFGRPLADVVLAYADPLKWVGLGGQMVFALLPVALLLQRRPA